MDTRAKGRLGEQEAEKYLRMNNYQILAKNYYTRWGEIDIIARDKVTEELVFVEVKMRQSDIYGYPEEAVDERKMKKLAVAAERYVEQFKVEGDYRFDCLAIEREIRTGQITVRHYKNIGFN